MNLDRSLAKLYKVTELMKDELDGKIMTKFAGLRAKLGYLIDDNSEDKKAKGTKMCVIKKKKLSLKIIKTVKKQLNLRMK